MTWRTGEPENPKAKHQRELYDFESVHSSVLRFFGPSVLRSFGPPCQISPFPDSFLAKSFTCSMLGKHSPTAIRLARYPAVQIR